MILLLPRLINKPKAWKLSEVFKLRYGMELEVWTDLELGPLTLIMSAMKCVPCLSGNDMLSGPNSEDQAADQQYVYNSSQPGLRLAWGPDLSCRAWGHPWRGNAHPSRESEPPMVKTPTPLASPESRQRHGCGISMETQDCSRHKVSLKALMSGIMILLSKQYCPALAKPKFSSRKAGCMVFALT